MARMNRRQAIGTLAGGALAAAFRFDTAGAAEWPTRYINLIVPYPPGGGVDFTARVLSDVVRPAFGQPLVIENRAGAGGSIGVQRLAESEPDGYTLAAVSPGPITIGPNLQKVGYDPLALSHITRLTMAPMILICRPDFPAKDLKSLVAYAKANPDKIRFANAGQGTVTHLAAELFSMRIGSKMIHVPYRGTSPAVTDIMSGVVDIFFSDVSAMANVEAKQVGLIAVSTAQRWSKAPDVPAVAEEIPNFAADSWYSLVGPPGMPAAIRERIEAEFIRALNVPDVKTKLQNGGLDAAPMPSAQFSAFVRKEFGIWRDVIAKAGITVNN